MTYEATLQKNGKIILPKAVIQELGLNQGDKVIFVDAKLAGETYFYLTTPMSTLIRVIKSRPEPTPR